MNEIRSNRIAALDYEAHLLKLSHNHCYVNVQHISKPVCRWIQDCCEGWRIKTGCFFVLCF